MKAKSASGQSSNKTPLWAILLTVFCTLLIAAGQSMMKRSAGDPLAVMLHNPIFILSVVIYIAAGVLMMFALKHGELSVLFPVVSLGFVWVALSSHAFLGERLSVLQIIGTVLVVAGVALIGHRATRDTSRIKSRPSQKKKSSIAKRRTR